MSEIPRVDKPWGYELHWAKTDRYVGKIIHIDKGHALSLQYHNKKDETIMLLSGKLLFEIQENGQLVQARGRAVRALPRHAGHGASHDRHRRLRRRRGLDAGARRCGAAGRPIRAGREEVTFVNHRGTEARRRTEVLGRTQEVLRASLCLVSL